MRLIDAKALERNVKEAFKENPFAMGMLLRWIRKQPTIEARPVVRGEWLLNEDGSGTCNRCRRTQKGVWDYDGWQNFCGHCGADMSVRRATE